MLKTLKSLPWYILYHSEAQEDKAQPWRRKGRRKGKECMVGCSGIIKW